MAATRTIPALRPRLRKAVLTMHVAVAVGWLGLDVGLLALGIAGLATDDVATMRAAYLAMGVFADVLIVPAALATLGSGIVLGLATPWGLVRYWWVAAKLAMTLAAATASVIALRLRIGEAVTAVTGVSAAQLGERLGEIALVLAVAPSVALIVYLTATALSVFKPWGRTPYGRRAGR